MNTYLETFDDGPGGWMRVVDNVQPVAALPVRGGVIWSYGPWWVDYNHAPPGAGYLQLLMCLPTRGPFGEHYREMAGQNRFVAAGQPLDFTNARFTVRIKGELEPAGARPCLLVQGSVDGIVSGWVLTGQPIAVSQDFAEQTLHLVPDEKQWRCLGARHDRSDMYGVVPLDKILASVNVNIFLVMFPVTPRPMGTLAGDPHVLRAGKDYPIWPSSIAQGYVAVDTIRVEFAGKREPA
ncbi:MAG: hypothetical protein FJ271_15325 [Planctomycetes bacterium]|nr:hypothetical protein [Planctomycetota bacterium]